MKALKSIVSANIRRERIRLGLTQEELAHRTRLSVRYISKVENDPPDVTLHNLDRIARGLGVPVGVLVVDSRAKFPKPSSKDADAIRITIRMLESLLEP